MDDLLSRPTSEYKCRKCRKGRGDHQAMTLNCPFGTKTRVGYSNFYSEQFFESSGKLTARSANAIKEWERIQKRRAELLREQSKIRAMTFGELVTAVVELISEKTNLGVTVERPKGFEREYAEIHINSTGSWMVDLGYMSVSRYEDGRYAIGGVRVGCFIDGYSEHSILNVFLPYLRELEDRANAEKK